MTLRCGLKRPHDPLQWHVQAEQLIPEEPVGHFTGVEAVGVPPARIIS